MNQQVLISQLKDMSLTPTIINNADSTFYLVGGEDNDGNFYTLENTSDKYHRHHSLSEAKDELIHLGVNQAVFEMITPYDEMIGSTNDNNKTRTVINF
ncbi:DUF6482 family protein [Vibrio sp.]|nr:DUF6482 family protein [Vibrio sp.]